MLYWAKMGFDKSLENHVRVRCVCKGGIVCSGGLTIVANVAIATGPALLEASRSSVLNFSLLYARVDIRI